MSAATDTGVTPIRNTGDRPRRRFPHKTWLVTGAALLVLLLLGMVLYVQIWPFSQKQVLRNLAEASDSTVTIRSFRKSHFPPGCTLEDVEFRHGADHFKFITIDKLILEGTISGMLHHEVKRITAVGAHVHIPPFGSSFRLHIKPASTIISELVANGTSVEFESSDPKSKPLVFDVQDAVLRGMQWGHPLDYQLKVHNPEPPGEISAQGKFGTFEIEHPEDTPFSGDFTFEQANLGVYGGIAGTLSSKGKFEGPLKHIHVEGTADVPDFEVTSGRHKVRLTASFDAFEDAMHGDTYLNRVTAHLGRTTFVAEGGVAGAVGYDGKLTRLHIRSRRGRIEDMLGLFITDPRSPISGEVSLNTQAELLAGDDPFLKRVKLDGGFGIGQGQFTNEEIQKDVDSLSAGARGESKEDPETVVSDLTGKVVLAQGVAQFSNLSFGVPGARAEMHGSYDLLNHRINLHGNMNVDTKISNTSSGVKALLLKFMDPLFKKKKKGEIVPVHIEGTYEKPQFGLDLGNPDKK